MCQKTLPVINLLSWHPNFWIDSLLAYIFFPMDPILKWLIFYRENSFNTREKSVITSLVGTYKNFIFLISGSTVQRRWKASLAYLKFGIGWKISSEAHGWACTDNPHTRAGIDWTLFNLYWDLIPSSGSIVKYLCLLWDGSWHQQFGLLLTLLALIWLQYFPWLAFQIHP